MTPLSTSRMVSIGTQQEGYCKSWICWPGQCQLGYLGQILEQFRALHCHQLGQGADSLSLSLPKRTLEQCFEALKCFTAYHQTCLHCLVWAQQDELCKIAAAARQRLPDVLPWTGSYNAACSAEALLSGSCHTQLSLKCCWQCEDVSKVLTLEWRPCSG